MHTKACTACRLEKPIAEFSRKAATKDGYRPTCRACESAYNAAKYIKDQEKRAEYREGRREYARVYASKHYAANRERLDATKKKYHLAHPEQRRLTARLVRSRRRASARQGDNPEIIRKWIKAAKKVCYWCGSKCTRKFHIDHYQPLSKGGEHRISNLVIACPTCNLRKNAKDPLEFAASVGRLF